MWKDIVASSADGRGMTVGGFSDYVNSLSFTKWRPSGIVIHNTGAPTLAQWKGYPAAKRIVNLVGYYRDQQHWSAGPHAFIADDFIWPFTPLNTPGVHSPSFNGTKLGFELVGDYSREDDDRGDGFKAKMNLVAACAIVCSRFGLDPAAPGVIIFHKEDPKTTHKDCPGKNVSKEDIISLIQQYMGSAGDLPHENPLDPEREVAGPSPKQGWVSLNVKGEGLNLRQNSSAGSKVIEVLDAGRQVTVLGTAENGPTKWLRVMAGEREGWVAARYVDDKPTPQPKEGSNAKPTANTPAAAAPRT